MIIVITVILTALNFGTLLAVAGRRLGAGFDDWDSAISCVAGKVDGRCY